MRIAQERGGGLLLGSGEDTAGWVRASTLGNDASSLAGLASDLPRLAEALTDRLGGVGIDVRAPDLVSPLDGAGKMLAIGLNYHAHAAEVGKPPPEQPMVFAKHTSALIGPRDAIEIDGSMTAEVDYEVELAVVIGRPARHVPTERALEHVLGYCVANDVSARDLQREAADISLSKGMDSFCPSGPWVTTADQVGSPHDLRLRTWVGRELRQDSTTADLVHDVPALIAHISSFLTLHPGDVLLTGTPAGVGLGQKPPRFLREGDVIVCEIEQLGTLRNSVTVSSTHLIEADQRKDTIA